MARTKKDEDVVVSKEQEQFVKDLVKQLNKDGKIVYSLEDENNPTLVTDFISTGSTLLDYAISNKKGGGIPVGRITELSGVPGGGKSVVVAHVIANTQKRGGIVVLLDTENAIDIGFLKRIGVDTSPSKLIYCQPETIEQCFDKIEQTIILTRESFPNKEKPVTIIWDSVAATSPSAEVESDFDPNSQMGIGAKAMAKGMRKITKTIGSNHVTLLLTNQIRDNFKMLNPYADPYTTPYGKALTHHISVHIRLESGSKITNDAKEVLGQNHKARVIKNRIGPNYRTADFPIMPDFGVDDAKSVYDFLHDRDIISKAGGWSKMLLPGDEELKFREHEWRKLYGENEKVRNYVSDYLEKSLVKVYDVDGSKTEESEAV